MRPLELATTVANVCERLKLPYFVTGSVASTYYGEYRTTLDVDFVVELPSWLVGKLCEAFPPPEWYVSSEAAMEAAQTARMFNIVHVPSGLKADIMIFRDTPYNDSRLHRRRLVELPGGGSAYFAAPEDVILKKLEAFRDGGSDKHLRDITGIVRVSGDELDYSYLEGWVLRNSVQHEWQAIKSRLGMA